MDTVLDADKDSAMDQVIALVTIQFMVLLMARNTDMVTEMVAVSVPVLKQVRAMVKGVLCKY
jgi:hypothetical protein